MEFRKLDMETWPRADIFRHFIHDTRCVMSLTVDMDVTGLLQTVHARRYQFYPAMIWAVSAAVNCRGELRMGLGENGEPGIWDCVAPYYADFHPEDQRFTRLVTEFTPDFQAFHRRFLEDRLRFADFRGFEAKDIPPNTFTVSCLPWVHYKSFDMHVYDSGMCLSPLVVWGRYEKGADGKFTMPLTLNIHHAAADGYHLCRFFSDVERFMREIQ